ncbi:MAG: PP2C family protein-serine/threonine phosphatase [Ilumatobacteraceae bacterium]
MPTPGHPPALLTDGTEIVELGSTGPLVGAFRATWRTDSVEIDPGSMLVIHTDGVTDALRPDRERFGETRLRRCISDLDPTATVRCIHESIEAFRSADRNDDVTVLAFSRARRGSTLEHGDTVTR